MSISKRLKQAEKLVAGSGANEAMEAELMDWLGANPYREGQGESFHVWCDRMPKHLVSPFAEYVRKHRVTKPFNLVED